MLKVFDFIGEITIMSWAALKEFFTGRQDWGLIVEQLSKGGVDSWSITILTAIFTGMVMAAWCHWIEPFGASIYTIACLAWNRKRLGLFSRHCSLSVMGFYRGSGFMAVTEQIDAFDV